MSKIAKETRRKLLAVHNNSHGFRGIFWDAARSCFRAEIGHGVERKRLGQFKTAKDAAAAYDIAAIERYGEDAALNFPMPGERQTKFGGFGCEHIERNIYISPDGRRHCNMCNREAVARYKTRMQEAGYKRKRIGQWFKEGSAAE